MGFETNWFFFRKIWIFWTQNLGIVRYFLATVFFGAFMEVWVGCGPDPKHWKKSDGRKMQPSPAQPSPPVQDFALFRVWQALNLPCPAQPSPAQPKLVPQTRVARKKLGQNFRSKLSVKTFGQNVIGTQTLNNFYKP